MNRAVSVVWIVAGSAATLALLWCAPLPLGIPDEWVWPRLPWEAGAALNFALALCGAAQYVTFAAVGGLRLLHSGLSRIEIAVWLIALTVAAFAWLWCVQDTAPTSASLGKGPFVLYYPGASGYFTHARYTEPDLQRFLTGYEALMQQRDVLHVGTHPPGLFCFFYGLIALVDRTPGLAERLLSMQPESVREAFAVIAVNSARSTHPLDSRDAAVLWLAMLIAQLATAATVIPLYLLFRWSLSSSAAFVAAALWPAVPAVAVFLPKSDAAYPALAALLVWLSISAWRRPNAIAGFFAGLICWLGLFLSLAFLPVIAFAKGVCLWDLLRNGLRACPRALAARWPTLCGASLGVFGPIVALWLAAGLNLPAVWWWNYQNHAGFYAQFSRTYALWLAVNPVELTIAVGWPLMGAALWTAIGWLCASSEPPYQPNAAHRPLLCIGGGVWALLWLSGKNSGEAARLWLLLMPGIVWLAADFPQPERSDRPAPGYAPLIRQLVFLALALGVCIASVHRVGGFHST